MSGITLRDVAKAAGVSHAVVSAVLREKPGSTIRVSAATRDRVISLAKGMGYEPNLQARGLREQKSFTVGLVLRDVNTQLAGDLIRGLNTGLRESDYSVAVSYFSGSVEEEQREIDRCLSRRVDGLIVNAAGTTSVGDRRWLQQASIPTIELFGSFLPQFPSLEIDFESDGSSAAQHLIDLGHRRVALVIHDKYTPEGDHPTAQRFARGFQTAVRAAGLEVSVVTHELASDTQWEQQCIEGGVAAFRQIYAEAPSTTGIVCYSDYHAYGVLRAARLLGVRVPEDVSVMGHYDLELSRVVSPALTSLDVSANSLGRAAGEMILAAVGGKLVASRRIASELKWRESTRPCVAALRS